MIIVFALILTIGILYFVRDSKSGEGLQIEKGDGRFEVIEGSDGFDEKFYSKKGDEIDKEKAIRYINSDIEITRRAIENFKNDKERQKRYQNRLIRLNELKEKLNQ
ncbi:MAG: hypothetical protein ACP5KG_09290 [Myxococcota bacterium]